MAWPQSFYELRRGVGCPMCSEGRPDDNGFGLRILSGAYADAYLQRASTQPGYVVVIWRGRHVVEPTELSEEEARSFWLDVLRVGGALETHFRPLKINYMMQGNVLPHLHAHVLPRYEAGDPSPGGPFPFPRQNPPPFPEEELQADAATLRSLLAVGKP